MSTGPEETETVVLMSLPVAVERDVFTLRRHGQTACRVLGVHGPDQVRMATIMSEVGRNLLGARKLTAELRIVPGTPDEFAVRFAWEGAKRPAAEVLAAAERLVQRCVFTESPSPVLELGQPLAETDVPLEVRAAEARVRLADQDGVDVIEELRNRNRDLLAALQESRAHEEELRRLNAELEETNQGVVALYSELSKELEETNSGVVALYAELEDKTRRLRLASEEKTRFWANVSHELRSPVNAVIALTRLLLAPEAEPLTEEQRQQVSLVGASGSTLLALVEELLDTAKAESGRLEPQPAEIDLRTLLHQLRGTLGGTAAEGVTFTVPDSDFPVPLVTDEVMLTRILRNVLSNGLKFTDAGEVALSVAHEQRDGVSLAVFTATDTGVGIPADQLERVFEEFYQVRGPHQHGRPGTGLGLPYARKLTELLGGRLTLTSTYGAGTRVVVELPAQPARQDARPRPPGRGEPVLEHVMIVDDDPAFVAALRPALDRLARRTTEITDSAAALPALREGRPDALLLDLFMPAPDGYRLLEAMAGDPVLAAVPVVVLTSADRDEVDRSRLTRARSVLGKTHLTAERLAAALGAAPAPDAAPDPPACGESGAR